MARLGAEVVGIDAAEENIECAKQHASNDPIGNLKYNIMWRLAILTALLAEKSIVNQPINDFLVAGRVRYICTTVESFAKDQSKQPNFDAVVASEVIEHVDNPPHFVTTCTSLIDDGGSFFLTTINRTQRSYVGAILAAEYVLRLLPTGTHDWNKFITPHELQDMLKNSGSKFRVRMLQGMFYFPFFDKWTWISDTGVNYALHAVKTKP